MTNEQKIRAIEKELGIELTDQQREVTECNGYPLFRLMQWPRRKGKTTVAMVWALVHGPDCIDFRTEARCISLLRNGFVLLPNMSMNLPSIPDPDLLYHPQLLDELFPMMQSLSKSLHEKRIAVPDIVQFPIHNSFLIKTLHVLPKEGENP